MHHNRIRLKIITLVSYYSEQLTVRFVMHDNKYLIIKIRTYCDDNNDFILMNDNPKIRMLVSFFIVV